MWLKGVHRPDQVMQMDCANARPFPILGGWRLEKPAETMVC